MSKTSIKFYKSDTNALAKTGKQHANGNTVAEGGLLFSKGGRIYTKEQDGVIEYYENDLTLQSTTVNKALGSLSPGTTLSSNRIVDVLNQLLFATYVPKWTSPKIIVNYSPVEDRGYAIVGSKVKVTDMSATVLWNEATAVSTPTGSEPTGALGEVVYTARGGALSALYYKDKDNVSLNLGNVANNTSYTYNSNSETNIPKTGEISITVSSVGSNTANVTQFMEFTSGNFGENETQTELLVKNSSGTPTTRTSENSYNDESGSVNTNIDLTTYKINAISNIGINKNFNSWIVKGYYPIYYSSAISKFDIKSDNYETATAAGIKGGSSDTLGGNISFNSSYAAGTGTTSLTNSTCYNVETLASQAVRYIYLKGCQIPQTPGDGQSSTMQILIPNILTISTTDYWLEDAASGNLTKPAGSSIVSKTTYNETYDLYSIGLPATDKLGYKLKITKN